MKQILICIASILTIAAYGQHKPQDIRTESYTLTIRLAAEPRATGKASGERLLSCSGCNVQEFAQLLMIPYAVILTTYPLQTKYDFKLTWKSGELPLYQESVLRKLGQEFGLKTSQTKQSVSAFRLVVTSKELRPQVLGIEMEEGVAYKKVNTKVYFYATSLTNLAKELTKITGVYHEADGNRKELQTLMIDTRLLDDTLLEAGIERILLDIF